MHFLITILVALTFLSTSCDQSSYNELVQNALHYEARGEWNLANDVYDQIIEGYPDYELPYINKGANLAQQKKYTEAIKVYKEGVKQFPENATLLMNIGLNYNRLNKMDSANFYFLTALPFAKACDTTGQLIIVSYPEELDAVQQYELYNLLVNNYYLAGEYTNCVNELQKCIRCAPRNSDHYYVQAYCYEQLGETDKSCESYRKAAALGDEEAAQKVSTDCKEVADTTEAPPLVDLKRGRYCDSQ